MTHYIIVKFYENIEKEKIINSIKTLFQKAIDEVKKIDIYESNIDLPNRYDLMIRMELSKDELIKFDNGDIHKEWKEQFGKYIMSKTIFDCE